MNFNHAVGSRRIAPEGPLVLRRPLPALRREPGVEYIWLNTAMLDDADTLALAEAVVHHLEITVTTGSESVSLVPWNNRKGLRNWEILLLRFV